MNSKQSDEEYDNSSLRNLNITILSEESIERFKDNRDDTSTPCLCR